MQRSSLVSVVVPAYNTRSTIISTLASVCKQTYRDIEVIVVDDGSTDDTAAVAQAAARRDGRIRVLSGPNAGVAAARNAGIAASCGSLIAPIDADDLWHPTKIAKQVEAMLRSGPGTGFVYTFYRRIDIQDGVLYDGPPWRFERRAFLPMFLLNFVGNGSSLLIRREALEDAGGYEPGLQRLGAQGCEDYLLQLLIARRWNVAVVPEYLTGYRMTPDAMSSRRERMARSHLLMLDYVRGRAPDLPAGVVEMSEAQIRSQLAVYHLLNRARPTPALREAVAALRGSVGVSLRVGGWAASQRLQGIAQRRMAMLRAQPSLPSRNFLEMDPLSGPADPLDHPLHREIIRLSELELRDEGSGSVGGPTHGEEPLVQHERNTPGPAALIHAGAVRV